MRRALPLAMGIFFSTFGISCGSVGSVGPVVTTTGEMATLQLRDGTEYLVELLAVGDSSVLCLPQSTTPRRVESSLPRRGEESVPVSASPWTSPRLFPDRVEEIPASSIERIEVEGFRNNRWGAGVLLTQVVPAVLLAVAAGSANADAGGVFIGALVPAAFSTLLYATSGVPTPAFEYPMSNEDLLALRAYARFGGALTSAQKESLLRAYGEGGAPRQEEEVP